MTTLRTTPGSSTPKQRQRLVILGRRKGLDLNEIRKTVGGSIKQLSAKGASEWIVRFGGGTLPNPPGKKPSVYKGKKPKPGVTRMITEDQIDQIKRLLFECFDGQSLRACEWLKKNFKVDLPVELATAKRAGEVIRVLKEMSSRGN